MTEKTITPENAEIIMIEQFTFWSEIIPLVRIAFIPQRRQGRLFPRLLQ